MRTLLIVLFLLPIVTFGQVSSWRTNPPQPRVSVPAPSIQSDVSRWRDVSPREYNRPQPTKPGSNIIINNNPWGFNNWGWGWNRWNMWGAPAFGWNFYSPMWYWNDWGYRQPGRVYIYQDGRRDTIRGKKPIYNVGLHMTNNKQLGGYFAVGNKTYFIMDFVSTYEPDRSTFFPYGTITQIDFPLISDLKKERTIYIGAGKRVKRTGFHALIGFGSENVYWRGRDAIGEITFPKYNARFTTIKIGAMRDFKNFTLKFDTDPIRGYSQLGLGINF